MREQHATRMRDLIELGQSSTDAVDRAAALAELQRVGADALREAVAQARREGVSWRDLAAGLGVAATTLHGQFRAGRGLFAASGHATPPLDTTGPADGNLPAARPDRFVGRTRELTDLRAALSRANLVTLTGTGGVGKTRLAAELAHKARGSYPGGVWWIGLASVSSGAEVAQSVAGTLRPNAGPVGTAEQAVAHVCRPGPALLVLDNCEHVVADCAALAARLLAAGTGVAVLATGREALRVTGEVVYPVDPLPVPEAGADLRRVDSVRLFVERACAVSPAFELTEELAGPVAQLCQRLDGVPLAIELAARQIAVLPPPQLLARLDDQLAVLSSGTRDAPPRQQSLRATIEWSYDLLDPDARAVFRRLSVLPSGFDQAGAGAVCADLGLTADRLWAILTALAGKSLLAPDPAGRGRLRMLESLRIFGRDRLTRTGELAGTHDRLLDWLLTLAPQATRVQSSTAERIRQRVEERDNLEYAMRIAEQAGDDRYPLLALTVAMARHEHGDPRPMDDLLHQALARAQADSPVRALILLRVADSLSCHGNYAAGKQRSVEALAAARRCAEPWLEFWALRVVTTATMRLGDPCLDIIDELVASARQIGRPRLLAEALNLQATQLASETRLGPAAAAAEAALAALAEEPESRGLVDLLHTAGAVALLSDEIDRARAYFTTGLDAHHGYHSGKVDNVEGLALVDVATGRNERALRLLAGSAAARADYQLPGDPWWADRCADGRSAAASRLPDTTVAAALTDGAALDVDQLIGYARNDDWPLATRRPTGPTLSAREREVAELVADGLTNRQIAARHRVSARTVASHLESIRAKLDLPTRAHITAWVTRERIAASEAPTIPLAR